MSARSSESTSFQLQNIRRCNVTVLTGNKEQFCQHCKVFGYMLRENSICAKVTFCQRGSDLMNFGSHQLKQYYVHAGLKAFLAILQHTEEIQQPSLDMHKRVN